MHAFIHLLHRIIQLNPACLAGGELTYNESFLSPKRNQQARFSHKRWVQIKEKKEREKTDKLHSLQDLLTKIRSERKRKEEK